MTSSVEECALRARSTHGVHHAIVEVNIVIGVVLGEVLVARVVPLVVDAVIGLTLGPRRSCCYRRFRRSHFKKNFTVWEIYSLQKQELKSLSLCLFLSISPSLFLTAFVASLDVEKQRSTWPSPQWYRIISL